MDDFEQAREEFLTELSAAERAQFSKIKSREDFLDGIREFEQFANNKKKWSRVFKGIEKCSEKLQPYFEVLSIFVSSHSEFAAIAWGAFRLVLQLSCNFITFFEKLGDLLLTLSTRIPAYDSLIKIMRDEKGHLRPGINDSDSAKFQKSLCAFYVDVFEIFRGIARVFSQKSGKLKRTPVVITQLLWQPFDVRFANLLGRLDMHREILNLQMDVMHFNISGTMASSQTAERAENNIFQSKLIEYNELVCKMKEEFSQTQKQLLLERIKAWLMPPSFAEAFERSSKLRQDGTADWIFETGLYKEWVPEDAIENAYAASSLKRFLWVRGNPGRGKSVLAAAVIQELMASDEFSHEGPLPLVSYFFFEKNSQGGFLAPRDHAYRSILSQLLHRFQNDKDILEVISYALANGKDGQVRATPDELLELMRSLATRIGSWYIVIDAIDECQDPDQLLLDLEGALGDRSAKVLLFSRPNVRYLLNKMKLPQILTITRTSVEADLRLYFDVHLKTLQDLRILPRNVDREKLVERLLMGADGMFQWARLMITHLKSDGLLQWEKLDIINKLETPENLDDMYKRILDLLTKKLSSEQSLARRLFLWLTFGKTTLSSNQLQDILTPVKENASDPLKAIAPREKTDEFSSFEHNIVMVSGGLVESRRLGDSKATRYCFIHGSVAEFFMSRCNHFEATYGSKPGTLGYLLPATCEAEAELAVSCLAYMFQRVPGQPLSGNMFEAASSTTLRELLPFLEYAVLYWPHHLASTNVPLEEMHKSKIYEDKLDFFYYDIEMLLAILSRFLLNKLTPMVWVEASYTFGRTKAQHDKIHRLLIQWATWANELDPSRLSKSSVDVPPAIAAFSGDLIKLQELWGDTLLVGPHQIWNDVTAFTSSPFFVQTSAVTIKSLTTQSSNRSALSTTPLSKISRDDPSSDLLAVLTVWPSKAFELCWRKSTARRKHQTKENQYDGWIAQYEIWNIGEDDPVVVEDFNIPIDKNEVELQYERFQKYVKSFSKVPSTSTAKKDLALHFPTSIDSNLKTFTILRTVYKRDQTTGPRTRILDSSASRWRPILMPVIHTIDSTLLKGSSEKQQKEKSKYIHDTESGAQSYDTLLKLHKTPAFRMVTSQNYILYQSIAGREALSPDEDGAATIAVFMLMNITGDDETKLLGCIEGGQKQGSMHHCVFHPTYPLLAFYHHSPTGISQIILWCFARDFASRSSFMLLNQSVLQSKDGFSTSSVATISGRPKYIQFSACGTQIIYQLHSSSNPHAKPIRDLQVFAIAEQQQAEIENTSYQPTTPHAKTEPTCQDLEKTNVLPPSMELNQPVFHGEGASTRLAFTSNRSVTLVHCTDNGVEEEQSLLSLPAWNDVKSVSPSIRMPSKTREDKVTIILNKTAQPFYTIGNGGEHTPPAVVRKDIRAIAKPRVKNSVLGKTGEGWQGIGDFEGSDGDEESCMSKRARIDNE